MRRNFKSFIFACIVLLSTGFIAPDPVNSEGKPSIFNVGVIIPLTGDLADYGVSIKRGFDLAIAQSPQRFSKIHFIFEDSRYDANTAVLALQKLKATDSIDLYYAWGVSPTEAIIPIAESSKLPLLVETTLKESVANKKYVVRAARTGERIAKALAEELAGRKIKKHLS